MEKSETHGGHETGQVSSAHQHSEISISAVVKFLAVLFVSAVVVDALMLGMLKILQYQHDQTEEPPPAMFVTEQQQYPPEPRLQGAPGSKFELQDPALDVKAYDEQQKKELDSYGWVDKSRGQVRIPIEQAMKLVLQRGFPTKPAAAASPSASPTQPAATRPQPGIEMPTGSSSGRVSEPRKE